MDKVVLFVCEGGDAELKKLFPDSVMVDVVYACSRTMAFYNTMDVHGRDGVAWLANYLSTKS